MIYSENDEHSGSDGVDPDAADALTLSEGIADPAPGSEEAALDRMEAEKLWREVERLARNAREVLTRRCEDDLTFATIGAALGYSESWAKLTMRAALVTLRARLKVTVMEPAGDSGEKHEREWTDEEDLILMQLWPSLPAWQIGEKLGRTTQDVQARRRMFVTRARREKKRKNGNRTGKGSVESIP